MGERRGNRSWHPTRERSCPFIRTTPTPYGAAISMTFLRVSPTGIQVTIDNGRRSYQFTVLTAAAAG